MHLTVWFLNMQHSSLDPNDVLITLVDSTYYLGKFTHKK
jgi:hypothetical protein